VVASLVLASPYLVPKLISQRASFPLFSSLPPASIALSSKAAMQTGKVGRHLTDQLFGCLLSPVSAVSCCLTFLPRSLVSSLDLLSLTYLYLPQWLKSIHLQAQLS